MSGFDLLRTGAQSLLATQSQLNTISQNINNVNTEGYSRQQAIQVSLTDLAGAQVIDIDRIASDFLTRQVWSDQSVYSQTSMFANMAGDLDDLLATDVTGISSALDDYFDALQNVVDDPVSTPNRELFLAQAEALANRFNQLDENLRRQEETANSQIQGYTAEVTSLANSIAGINEKIRVANASGNAANELLDQRDQFVNELSELTGVTVVEDENSLYNIYVGNGQPLVVGTSANQMVATPSDQNADELNVQVVLSNSVLDVTESMKGGKLGGLIEFRDDVLQQASDELDLIALGFTASMNDIHREGITPENEMGANLFNEINDLAAQTARISEGTFNTSSINSALVEVQDISQLAAGGYTLSYDGPNDITLIRNSDEKQFNINFLTPETGATTADAVDAVDQGEFFIDTNGTTLSFAVEGFKVTLSSAIAIQPGDKFFIDPSEGAADQLELVLTDGSQLALASPVRVTEDLGNTGTGVATVEVTDANAFAFGTEGYLDPPLDIVFNNTAPLTYTIYDITDKDNPQVLDLGSGPLANQAYVAGEPIQVDGYAITIANAPEIGDRFRFEYNEDGVSDNRNALALSDLQQTSLFANGSYQDLYGSLLEKVGTDTNTARIAEAASQSVLDSSIETKSEVSGVNLDEEAAKLVQYQQAYQASSQIIRVSQSIFDTLLSSI